MTSTSLPALSLSGLMVFALTSLSLPLTARAQAPCAQWNPATLHEIVQGQNTHVNIHLQREGGSAVKGSAAYNVVRNQGGERVQSSVDGGIHEGGTSTIEGNRIHIEIDWNNGTYGVYDGQVGPDGRITGTAYDRKNPSARAPWSGTLACQGPPPAAKRVPIPSTPSTPMHPMGKHRVQSVPDATCASPFVWRTARPDDLVCVTSESRDLVANENRSAPQRWNPGGGAYGAATCKTGFVWREAFDGDKVCVTPERRTQVQEENQQGPARRAAH